MRSSHCRRFCGVSGCLDALPSTCSHESNLAGRDAMRPPRNTRVCHSTAKVCWGADITTIVAMNQDRLRALDAQMWNRGVPFHVRL